MTDAPSAAGGPGVDVGSGAGPDADPGTGSAPPDDVRADAGPDAERRETQQARGPLRRSREQKMISGVCGGLGRYCDVDPVIFRVALAVLAVAGGLGLIVYGLCWLMVPFRGEEENEGRRLLSGRVEGTSLTAMLCALVGCGLFLSMINNPAVMSFSVMLSLAVVGAAYWSYHRNLAIGEGTASPSTAQTVADAPPEAQAPPPSRGHGPSWWRDPIIKDGTTGHLGEHGYLWGPDDGTTGPYGIPGPYASRSSRGERSRRVHDRASLGGSIFLAALVGGGTTGRALWASHTVATSLQGGLACALAVIGLGIAVSCRYGHTGPGTAVLAVLTSALLVGAAVLPQSVTSHWTRRTWAPATAAAVHDRYALGTGDARLRLTHPRLTHGQHVTTRAEVGAGRLAVTVPRDVRVRVWAKVGVGDILMPGERDDGVHLASPRHRGVTLEPHGRHPQAGTWTLYLKVGLGEVEVDRT